MANGWGPRNGQEMISDIYQRMRFANREPRFAQYPGEIVGSIDASGGVDVSPASDVYIEQVGDDLYPAPAQPPSIGTPPPDSEEDSSPTDGFEDGPLIVSGATKVHGDYWYAGGSTMNFSNYSFDSSGYGTTETLGPSMEVSPADSKQFILVDGGLYSFRWRQSLIFTVTGSEPRSVQVELHMSPFTSIEAPYWTEVLVDNHYTVGSGKVAVGIDKTIGPIPLPAGTILTPKIGWIGAGDPTALTNFGMYLFVTKWS